MDCIRAFGCQPSAVRSDTPLGIAKNIRGVVSGNEDLTRSVATLPDRSREFWELPRYPDSRVLNHFADDGAGYATLVERADQRGGPSPGHSDEQPSARLRVIEWEQLILVHAVRRYAVLQVLPVALQPARV